MGVKDSINRKYQIVEKSFIERTIKSIKRFIRKNKSIYLKDSIHSTIVIVERVKWIILSYDENDSQKLNNLWDEKNQIEQLICPIK